MASSMNLSPNLLVVIVQAVIFFINVIIIKHLFLKPFLSINAKRQELTTELQTKAQQAVIANKNMSEEISLKLKAVSENNKKRTEELKNAAILKSQDSIKQAKEQANSQLVKLRDEIKNEIQNQKDKIPKLAQNLGDVFYSKVIP